MSLLLDALKKAADDKEKMSRAQPLAEPPAESLESQQALKSEQIPKQAPEQPNEQPIDQRADVSSNRITQTSEEDLRLQPIAKHSDISEAAPESSLADAGELTLDLEKDELPDKEEEIKSDEFEDKFETVETRVSDLENNSSISGSDNEPDTQKYTISDSALSLLIDKTNRDVKQSKKIFIASVVIASLAILLSSGLYYYTDMQAEIDAIERKHQIAMQSMRLKTNSEKTPDKTEIIRNLVSDAALEEKVQYAKTHMASVKNAANKRPQAQPKAVKKIATAELSIKRTNKSDPVGERLDAAWSAYENGNYDTAKQLYKDTLRIEGSNRDAQLGLGAIAVIEKDNARARNIYLSLLRQDPRDPIASAALAGLSSDKESLESENDYLISLLEKNPDAPHLNFSVGNNYAQQNQWKSAQQYYFKAWQYDNENADYIFNLAVSMDQLDKPQQAIGFYRDSLDKSMNKQVSFSREAVQKRINELSEL